MKIVDVAEFYSATSGGVRTYVDQKFLAAAAQGHSLIVIAPGKENREETREGGRLIWVKAPQMPFDTNYHVFWGGEDVWRILDREAPDVVEGSSPWRGGWLAARWQGPAARALFMHADPVAVYPQTLLSGMLAPATIDRLFGWFWSYLRRLNNHFDSCVVAGAWLAARFEQHGLKNLQVVPFGVDTKFFGPGRRDEALRVSMLAACGLGPEAALLINVGRHHPEKRIPMLIDAVTRAQQTRPIGLYIVGDGLSHGSVRAKAADAAHIHVAGRVTDRALVSRMMASADALLHGSTAETYGFVVAEALCCGTPLVVPRAGGAGDLASPGYAETYAPGDSDDAAAAILRLLARDRSDMATAALAAGTSKVGDIDAHFVKLFAHYAALIDRRKSRPHAAARSGL